MRKKL